MGFVPGQKITPTLELVRLLGQGGMGSVWSARHSGLDLDVAVKFISADLAKLTDPIVVERFRREAKLAARIDSPHVVRTLDHGLTSEGFPYIVMELLRGESLFERLDRKKRLSPHEVARIVRESARGLERAHSAQIVHRDIKPHNLFLAESPEGGEIVKVLDFGVAKARTSNETQSVATSTGVLIGTPQYMSPEQLMRAGPVETSADLWALAVVAYEAMVGKLPFRGETLAATIMAITRADMAPASSVDATLPPSVDAWFQRALAIDPAKRFKSARELADALATAVEGIPVDETKRDALPGVTGPVDLRATEAAGALERAEGARSAAASTAEFLAEQGLDARLSDGLRASDSPSKRSFALAETIQEHAKDAVDATLPSAVEPAKAPPAAKTSGSTKTALSVDDDALDPPSEGPATRYRRRWTPLRIAGLSGALLAVGVGAGVLVSRSEPPAPAPRESASVAIRIASPPPSGTATGASPSAAPAPPRRLGVLERTSIDAGLVPLSRVWLPTFTIARAPGDEGTNMVEAQAACQAKAMSLCTESQWARACAAHPEIADSASWTASTTQSGAILRGKSGVSDGDRDCGAREVVAPDTQDPARIGVCCSRVVGVAGETSNPAFLATTSAKLLDFETAANAGNGAKAALLVDDPMVLFTQRRSRKEVEDWINWRSRSRFFMVHDACELAIEKRDDGDAWTADCAVTVLSPEGVTQISRHYVRGGPKGLLLVLTEPKAPISIDYKTPKASSSAKPK